MKGAEFERTSSEQKAKAVTGASYYGDESTTLKDRKKEIGRGLLQKMCADLGINPHDL